MRIIQLVVFSLTAAMALPAAADAGPDWNLAAESPQPGKLDLGMAGEYPAKIARYLLARGASTASISPDGNAVAFKYNVTGSPQLWLIDAPGGTARQLTFGNGITFFQWAPNSRELIYGADNNGDERESYYLISKDGASERLVLPATESGFRNFGTFSADSKQIFYASTERNGIDFDIYRADVADGRAERLYEGTFAFYPRRVSRDGRWLIVTESVGEDADNLYLLNLKDNTLKTLSAPDPRANHHDGGFAWRNDSRGFYFATNRNREFAALTYYDLLTGKQQLIKSTDHDIEQVRLCAEDQYLIWSENRDGFTFLAGIDLQNSEPIAPNDMPGGVHSLTCSQSRAVALVRTNSWSTPGDLTTWFLRNGQTQQIFKANLAGLDPARLVKPVNIRITARDGVETQGLLYLPENSNDKLPILFMVHGGPTAQAKADFSSTVQYYVGRGMAVFESNVRGSTGFGRTYAQLDDREKRLDSVRDLVDMLAYFESHPRIDTSRAAVIGGSYGGYAVNAVLTAYPEAFKAGVALFGVADWVTALAIASPALKASDRIEYGDINEPRWRKFYMQHSPIRQADQIRVPVLYSHGVNDPRIDISETEIMVKRLRANGVDAPYIRMPDEGHGWRKLNNQIFYFTREAQFLEQQLSNTE
ncbi:MAG: S9 family peptidase [Pseudomonadota bacterium]